MMQSLLEHCASQTLLCIAVDLTLPTEQISTRTIADWRLQTPLLDKRPAVFLLYVPSAVSG